ncbi:MAG: hypothetical protein BMS9Abin05_0574 [Rhodothermia bacterium]|nr:MAG: hypothetical protein BMS9Abin05_0574 [Rhodothermia bacterium]
MTNLRSGRSALALLGIVVGLIVLDSNSARAQVGSINPYGLSGELANPLEGLQRRLSQSALSNAMLPMEGAVDPDTYIVGPGDIFSISMPLIKTVVPEIAVGADGRMTLPETGPVYIAGLTLSEARDLILSRLKESFQNMPVDVVLLQSRQFYVHVAGAVPSPGRYLALPVARVSTILEIAFADTSWSPVSNRDLRPSLRNIQLIRVNGDAISVDLMRYFASGNTDMNPYLQDGDVIQIPGFDPAFSSVYIDGAVLFPGPYDSRSDDTISSLIDVAGGISAESSISIIRVRRENNDGSVQTFEFDLADLLDGDAGLFPIKPRDNISVARVENILGSASVDGMVRYPGTYPIVDGVTTMRELVEKAGGLRDDALIRGTYLVRRALPDATEKSRRSVFEKPLDEIEKLLVADSTAIMLRLRMTDLDFLSRAYFAQEIRMQNRVSIDFEGTMNGDSGPTLLRDQDRLVVPRDEKTVYVFGQVRRPGFVAFEESRDAEFYIKNAGGRGDFALNTVIIQPGTGDLARNVDQNIGSGDMIFVDRKTDVAENAELQRLVSEQARSRADAQIRTMQTVLQSVTTIASVVALIISLSR